MQIPILALLVGKVRPFADGETSAIAKAPLDGPVRIGLAGIEGDEQADPAVHGGPDKALHHYPADHYGFWAAKVIDHPLLNAPGAFGENISTHGLTEDMVCIGDRFRMGTALVEISQGRQPCWKQGLRMEWSQLPAMMVRERCCGWYYRVIEPGVAEAGDVLEFVDRPLPDWTVRRTFGLIIAGDHKGQGPALRTLAAMPQLFDGWRERAAMLAMLDEE